MTDAEKRAAEMNAPKAWRVGDETFATFHEAEDAAFGIAGVPVWVHDKGRGCQKEPVAVTQEHIDALNATGVKLGKFVYFATPDAMFKALAPVKHGGTKAA